MMAPQQPSDFEQIMQGPQANESLSLRFKKCLGAMRVLLSFFDQYSQLKVFQGLDKWWYDVGVGRIQTRWLSRGFYVHDKVFFIQADRQERMQCYIPQKKRIEAY